MTDSKFRAFYQTAVALKVAVVFWRLPGEAAVRAIADTGLKPVGRKVDIHTDEGCFAFAPFIDDEGKATLLFNQDISLENGELKIDNFHHLPNARFESAFQSFSGNENSSGWFYTHFVEEDFFSRKSYCSMVEKAKRKIGDGAFHKVVLARKAEKQLPADFDPLDFFFKLCDKYPDAFVSLVSSPFTGTWIGASPETLLEVNENEICTMALAGTTVPDNAGKYVWQEKEREEQKHVSDYIREIFNHAGMNDVREEPVETSRAGHLGHLITRFKWTGNCEEVKKKASHVLYALHPTPAVCGMPKPESMDFILGNEPGLRKYYSGFLGPVGIENSTRLFVNLRCMQLHEKSALLYAGAGIVEDSMPENEWEETELKMETLLRMF